MASKGKAKKTEPQSVDDLVTSIISETNETHGEGTSMLLEGSQMASVNKWVGSGAAPLDNILGGGYPAGRVVEIFGAESNGKTSFALEALANTQKDGGIGIFLDTEHALDKSWAVKLGVDLKKLVYVQPETMEDLFDYVDSTVELIAKKAPDKLITIVWDSVAATPTKSEIEGEYGESVMGIHARIMSQAFRKITKRISKHNVLFICLNQIRSKIGVSFGNPHETFGGKALKFYSTIRMEVRKVATRKDGRGIDVKVKIVKNKVAPPFGETQVILSSNAPVYGIDRYSAVLTEGFEAGMFGTAKGWYEIDGKKYRLADGVDFLRENDDKLKLYEDTLLSMD